MKKVHSNVVSPTYIDFVTVSRILVLISMLRMSLLEFSRIPFFSSFLNSKNAIFPLPFVLSA